jgi:hypothetical protein
VTEPELGFGDFGEWVTQLQARLQALGHYDGSLDGDYGEHTRTAVEKFQLDSAIEASGAVDAGTWRALGDAERAAAPGTDPHWSWDGDHWQRVDGTPAVEAVSTADALGGAPSQQPFTAEGEWVWDGQQWQPVTK